MWIWIYLSFSYNKMHIKILQTIFTFVCIIIFVYFSYQSLSEYFAYKTVSKQNLDRQESQLMPRICFSSSALAEKKLRKLGISLDEYTQGIWTSNFVNYSTAKEYEIKQIFGQIACLYSWLTDTLDTKPATSHAPTWTFGPILCQNRRWGSLNSASCLVRQFQCQGRSSPTPCSTWSQRLAATSVSPLDSPWCTFSCRSGCFGNKFCTGPGQKMRVVCLHRNRALVVVTYTPENT